jgi:multicomponent Na+:H+ antiporter subunit D
MVGIPPLSGFWPKIYLFGAGFARESYVLVGAVIVASFLTLYVAAKLWAEAFWKEVPADAPPHGDLFQPLNGYGKALLVTPIVLLAAVSLYIGLGAESVARLSGQIARELVDPAPYVNAVLGTK